MSRTYEEIVTPLGRLVEDKQRNYGDSFGMETKDPIGTFVDARNEELATESELWMRWSAVVWAEWQDQGDAGWTFTASCETCDSGETVWSRLSEQADLLRVEKETFARMALPLPPSPPLLSSRCRALSSPSIGPKGTPASWPWRKTMPPEIGAVLREIWEELRDDASPVRMAFARGAISALHQVGLLTEEQEELWQRRIETCPGHDCSRAWCAYCGDVVRCEHGPSEWCEWCDIDPPRRDRDGR